MKFGWFHLMPYRWLPADFRERYHRAWVDLPSWRSNAGRRMPTRCSASSPIDSRARPA